MAAMHSQLYRDFHIRFEREPGSRYVDIYMPGLPEPITIGITDFIATSADAGAVIADFHAEQQAAAIILQMGARLAQEGSGGGH